VPELGDVLGGVLAEVVRGRLAADALTAQLLAAYQRDPALSMLSVPRVVVREMTVTLRFAVNSLESPPATQVEAEREAEDWSRILRDRVLPRVIDTRLTALPRDERTELREMIVEEPPVILGDRLRTAVEGQPEALLEESVSELVARVRAVPLRLRRPLGTIPELRAEIDREVRAEFDAFLEQRAQFESVQRVLRSRLDVEIVTDDLQARPPQAVQELTLTLSMSDIETAVVDTGGLRPRGG
jgi:hypothetical protein